MQCTHSLTTVNSAGEHVVHKCENSMQKHDEHFYERMTDEQYPLGTGYFISWHDSFSTDKLADPIA